MNTISAQDPHPRVEHPVEGTTMSAVDVGEGAAIVFLHGNPTSSYLWRNVITPLAGTYRCVAPDLIGMGRSGESLDGSYRFVDHASYLDAWFEAMAFEKPVVLVVHDWGSALGFHWARRHPDRVRGIAYMEAVVMPMDWADWNEQARPIFEALRSPAGEEMILAKNLFIERILPGSVLRTMTPEEMDEYRRPFVEPGERRRPMLTWPRQIPLDGEPADVVAIVREYADWLSESPIPKLFINADPGAILIGRQREFCRSWPNQTEVTVRGSHFIQEDSPAEIAEAVGKWMARLS